MPAHYEAIRVQNVKNGMGESTALKAAKTSAAKIFNSTRKGGDKPVTGKSE